MAAAASSLRSSPPSSSTSPSSPFSSSFSSALGGRLYACGCGAQLAVNESSIDRDGDVVYPSPIRLPSSIRIIKAAADIGVFGALSSHGELFLWGKLKGGWIIKDPLLIPSPLSKKEGKWLDMDVGDGFAIALHSSGAIFIIGSLTAKNAPTPPSSTSNGGINNNIIPPINPISLPSSSSLLLSSSSSFSASSFYPLSVYSCASSYFILYSTGEVYGYGPLCPSPPHSPLLFPNLSSDDKIIGINVGSLNAGVWSQNGKGWLWGDGGSGQLGIGKKITYTKTPIQITLSSPSSSTSSSLSNNDDDRIVSIGCTRGQPFPKRIIREEEKHSECAIVKGDAGQEGPRIHVVTASGSLYISGTCHKGLGANHLYKIMCPSNDHIQFYRVGGKAADKGSSSPVFTGALEGLKKCDNDNNNNNISKKIAWRMGMNRMEDFNTNEGTGYLSSVKIIESIPSHIHSAALSSDGRIFMWGCGSDGRLGLNGYLSSSHGKRRLKCYISTPSVIERFDDHRILSFAVGRYCSLFIVAVNDK